MNIKYFIKCLNDLAAFTLPYMALAYGLKLDGYIQVPWTLILSPVWFPLAVFLVLFVASLCLLITRRILEIALKVFGL